MLAQELGSVMKDAVVLALLIALAPIWFPCLMIAAAVAGAVDYARGWRR